MNGMSVMCQNESFCLTVSRQFARFCADESGATAIEYAMIAGLVSIGIVAAVSSIGTKIQGTYLGPIAGALP